MRELPCGVPAPATAWNATPAGIDEPPFAQTPPERCLDRLCACWGDCRTCWVIRSAPRISGFAERGGAVLLLAGVIFFLGGAIFLAVIPLCLVEGLREEHAERRRWRQLEREFGWAPFTFPRGCPRCIQPAPGPLTVRRSNFVAEGEHPHYKFTCPYCHSLWVVHRWRTSGGQVEFRWLLAGWPVDAPKYRVENCRYCGAQASFYEQIEIGPGGGCSAGECVLCGKRSSFSVD